MMPRRTFGRPRLLNQAIQLLDHHRGPTHIPAQRTLGHDKDELTVDGQDPAGIADAEPD
jgi:hypothetical protein